MRREIPVPRAKIVSLRFLRPEIRRIAAQAGGVAGGAESAGFCGFGKGKTPRLKLKIQGAASGGEIFRPPAYRKSNEILPKTAFATVAAQTQIFLLRQILLIHWRAAAQGRETAFPFTRAAERFWQPELCRAKQEERRGRRGYCTNLEIASKVAVEISCSILQASSRAVFSSTPICKRKRVSTLWRA